MKMSRFLSLAPTLFQQGISVHLQSSPGVGKSDAINNELPKVMRRALGVDEFGIKLFNLTSVEAPDVRGFAVPRDVDGRLRTLFTQSPMIPVDMPKHGVVFLDEFSQAEHDVQKAAADFKLCGRAGDSQLDPTWQVWSAGNRMCDKAGVNKPLSHVTNRHVVVNLDFDINDYTDWATRQSLHPLFIAFANFKPGALTEWDNAIAAHKPLTGAEPFCSPRSYSRWAALAHAMTGGHIDESIHENTDVLELGIGMVGKAAATEALAFMKVASDLPTLQQILSDPEGTAKALPKGRPDVILSCVHLAVFHMNKDNMTDMVQFIYALPKEFQVATMKRALDKLGGAAINHPSFATWISQNRALITESFM